jgi:hypothetical protein
LPWTGRSARGFTKKARSPAAKRKWAKVANKVLRSGKSEGAAVRIANAVVKKGGRKRKK